MRTRHFFGLALLGCSIVFYETLLTRLFSTTLWYHFGFLAISLAMLGITASGLLVFLRPRLIAPDGFERRLARAALAFAISTVLAAYFHLTVSFVGVAFGTPMFYLLLFLHVTVLAIPFFCGGLVVSMLLAHHHRDVSRLYFVDLAGSGLGAALLVVLLNLYSGPSLVFLVGCLAAIAAVLFGERRQALLSGSIAIGLAILFLGNDLWGLLRVRFVKSYGAHQIQEEEVPPPAYEKWTPVARTTAVGPLEDETGTRTYFSIKNDAGAPTTVWGAAAGTQSLLHTTQLPAKAYLEIAAGARILIIGSGGGRDVWAALLKGVRRIDAVELSPATVALMRGPLAEFSGNVYLDERVAVHVGEGRSFVEHAREKYRAIELTMVDSWIGNAAGAFLFNESHLYTEEAFRSYLRNLEPEGVLVVTRYFGYDETLRVTSTMISAMEREGIGDPANQIFVVRSARNVFAGTVFGFRSRPSPELVASLERKIEELGGVTVWRPYRDRSPERAASYDRIISDLLRPEVAGKTRAEVLASYPRDASPTTDDRPFFFFSQRSIFTSDATMHPARRWALPFVAAVVLILSGLALATMVFPLLAKVARNDFQLPSPVIVGYFACLGVGFMLVEVPLIQRFVLFLGHPTYAFVVVLTTLLIASGIGSAVSGKLIPGRHLIRVLGSTVMVVILTAPAIDPLLRSLLGLPFAARLAVTAIVVAPVGFLMGMPFPLGIRLLASFSSRSIPWAWAINGVFSVLTTGLSLLLALAFGFRATLLLGGVAYGLAALATRRLGTASLGSAPEPAALQPAEG